jgi:hypothetical protein
MEKLDNLVVDHIEHRLLLPSRLEKLPAIRPVLTLSGPRAQ